MSGEKTDIWMPLYIGDYLAATQHLSAEQSGAYLHLLMHQWRNGALPADVDALRRIARVDSGDPWSNAWGLLKGFFSFSTGAPLQMRLEKIREEWAAKKAKAVEKSAKANATRWGKPSKDAPSTPQGMPKGSPSPSPSPSPSSKDKDKDVPPAAAGGPQPNPVELIYEAYPRKEARGAALQAIARAVDRVQKGEGVVPSIPDRREAQIYLYRRAQTYAESPAGSRSDKTLIPHPSTWFNQSRYLDDDTNWQHTGDNRGSHQQRSLTKGDINQRAFDEFAAAISASASGGQVPPVPRGLAASHPVILDAADLHGGH